MKTSTALFIALLTAAVMAHAGPRTSANYSIITDTADGGGQFTTSAAYTNNGSAGTGSLSTAATPVEFAKSGYVGQLYDVTSLSVTAPSDPATVNGGATLQFGASEVLDDASLLSVAASGVAWSVVSGPITGINSAGLATAGPVYQNTAATVQGIYGGLTGSLVITVTDLNGDSFGIYAGDGIPDSWQVQYFGLGTGGLGNPQGVASADFDGTGQTNLFKYVAGLDPTDDSRFTVTISPTPGQPGQINVTFSPYITGHTYTVIAKSGLTTLGGWTPIDGSAPNVNGSQATITDLSATGAAKFYQVQISQP